MVTSLGAEQYTVGKMHTVNIFLQKDWHLPEDSISIPCRNVKLKERKKERRRIKK